VIDSLTLPRCRLSALFAALAAVLAACGGNAPTYPDSGGGTAPDAALTPDAADSPPDAAGQPDSGPLPDAAPVTTRVTAIGAGNNVTCAVLETGAARCWGANEQGQLGGGDVTDPKPSPTDVVGLTDADSVGCGLATCCARTQGGGAQCWGWNDQGALGANAEPGELGNRPMPGSVVRTSKRQIDLDDVTALSVGRVHSCALRSGSIFCWGWNQAGQGGQTPGAAKGGIGRLIQATPTSVVTDATHIAASSGEHTCAIADGEVSCWGLDFQGQLGDGTPGELRGTATVVPGLSGASAVAGGFLHTCAIADGGKGRGVFCWGLTNFGQTGAAPPGQGGDLQPTPFEVSGLGNAVAVTAGESHSCALLDDGQARCWGANSLGQLGDGLVEGGPHTAPVTVQNPTGTGPLEDIVQITAGLFHTCAITADGRAYCWGANDIGQLGQGKGGAPVPLPLEVPVVTK
jgi:alpha-tubulin suppressor-like RCC1 family protein